MNWYEKKESEAAEELTALLSRPLPKNDSPSVDEFDPWDIFPIYGSYSSEFDDMALLVLSHLRDGYSTDGEELAHEMFREMLCKKGLCDYGTSPRVCFPTSRFKPLLPEYIAKWEQYYAAVWGES